LISALIFIISLLLFVSISFGGESLSTKPTGKETEGGEKLRPQHGRQQGHHWTLELVTIILLYGWKTKF
jgi:hypothetical protein